MCGIVGYKGRQECLPFLLNGLKRLEYRGYDSAGIAIYHNGKISVKKQAGSVEDLTGICDSLPASRMGMGHTRWATHGSPCTRNAHPHTTHDGRLCIVHNGIIENYRVLAAELKDKGYMLISDTDTEVLLYLIYDYLLCGYSLVESVRLALNRVTGAYAIVVMDNKNPDRMVIAKLGSPLVVGLSGSEFMVASDLVGLADYFQDVIYLEDGVVVEITDQIKSINISNNAVSSMYIDKIDREYYDAEKSGCDTFMEKEILEQPKVVSDCLAGRINGYLVKLGGLVGYEDKFISAKHITIVACGSSWHAALLAKYYIEELTDKLVTVEYASEFCYRKPKIDQDSIVIAISQSGETADTLAAVKIAKQNKALTVGVCNVVNSSLSRMTDCGVFLRAGMEIGVASTKAFTNQVLVLLLIAMWIEQISKEYNVEYRIAIINALHDLSKTIQETLSLKNQVEKIANKFKKMKNCLYLGRGYNFPIALEGALKLKEISYVHAEGYPAAEMKHGPIALIDRNMPVVILANNKNYWDKLQNNIKEIQARGGKVILIHTGGDLLEGVVCDINVPAVLDILSPFISVVILQMFAYYSAILRECNVDKPRNLAKSVTVE